jgi:hypothetical protein
LHSIDLYREAGYHWRLRGVVPPGFEWATELQDDEVSAAIFELVDASPDLREIVVSACFDPDKVIREVLPLLLRHSKPYSINVSGQRLVTDELLKQIANNVPWLVSLDVSDCPSITGDGIFAAMNGCANLSALNVSRCRMVNDKICEAILRFGKSLRSFKAVGCMKLPNELVESLNLSCQGLTEVDLSFTAIT